MFFRGPVKKSVRRDCGMSVAHRGAAAENYIQLTKQNRSLVSNWFGKC